jgi:ATP-dependent exoDNAse (exonuclease V) beta subunit
VSPAAPTIIPPSPGTPALVPDAEGDEAADEARVDTELPLPEALRLERNLAILAGAGAGKTYSLVTTCLHVLSGARAGFEPVPASALGLLTFTDKAAGEMRARLRERLSALADGVGKEPELEASFAALGRPFPRAGFWRGLRDELGAATIGTFHSLCTQLLRRAPPGSQVSPHFELLDEREARLLLTGLVERELLRRLERESPIADLVGEIGFTALVQALAGVSARLREEGQSPRYAAIADAGVLRERFERTLGDLRAVVAQAQGPRLKEPERLARFSAALARVDWDSFPVELPELRAALHRARGEPWVTLRHYVSEHEKDRDPDLNLSLLYGAARMAPFEAEVRDVLEAIAAQHEAALREQGVLDFTGLLVQARDLLRDDAVARREAQARFQVLLVDEFQDTNRLQLELVLLLAERREGAPRPVSTAFEARHREALSLPLEPGALAVVGDRKQSIYEFRGADVSVFEVMARCIEVNGGGRAYLRTSRRSTAAILAAFNAGFPRVLGREAYDSPAADFEVVYVPAHDDLAAHRSVAPAVPPLLWLTNSNLGDGPRDAETQRADDAEAIARALAYGLASSVTRSEGRSDAAEFDGARALDGAAAFAGAAVGRTSGAGGAWTVVDRGDGKTVRPARGGDVALLFQRFTQLETYRQALVRHGVRHRVVRGRGFYAAQEVLDVAALLAVIADGSDALSLATVLRSPMVGLRDSALVSLARPVAGRRWGLDATRVLQGRAPLDGLDEGERARLERLRGLVQRLSGERDRLGLRALLRVALDELGYRVAVAAGPFGEQALANLDKLLVFASARERRGASLAAFAQELRELADTAPREDQGDVVDELDLDAVTLCTVHQAKGLEWPIVVLPDLVTRSPGGAPAVRFDRELGLAVRPIPFGEVSLESYSATKIQAQRARRERAESLRLLYVALTRARDLVVFGLVPPRLAGRTWAKELAPFREWQDVRALAASLDVAALPAGPAAMEPALDEATAARELEALVARTRAARVALPRVMTLPVTQLQDFRSCPRRFHLAHQVGLAERRVDFHADAEEGEGDADVRSRGTAAHRLLELVPLTAVGTPTLGDALRTVRHAQGLERLATDDVLAWVEGVLGTPFFRAAAKTPARVHRELPFALRLDGEPGSPGLVLRGQIDLVVETPEAVLIVDYKTSKAPPAGLEPYRFQLECYALAARRLFGAAKAVKAGLVFLREDDRAPRWLDGVGTTEATGAALLADATALATAQREDTWGLRDRATCEALGCGYVYRCHPRSVE